MGGGGAVIDWTLSGRTTSMRYVRVSWPDMGELGEIKGVTGCTIEENSLSALKVSGTLDYADMDDIGDDMIRIYSDSEAGGKRETVCHATLFATTPESTWSGESRTGAADMYSVLWVMQQGGPEGTYTVEAGQNAVSVAAKIARDCNLAVVATASDKTVATSHTWDDGASWLEIANWLLDFAGFGSATVDAFGNVIMAPYVDPGEKAVAWTFSDTVSGVSDSEISHEYDTYCVPNVVRAVCSNADGDPMVAVAINDDPENPYSTVRRKKRIVRTETLSDIADQAALEAKARELLLSGMSVVEKIEIGHSWACFNIGDAVQIDYWKSGKVMKMAAVARTCKMTPDLDCTTTVRRFVNLLEVS